jgi:Flp pilus assembly protein TadD
MRDRCLAYNVLGIIAMREGREAEGRAAFVAALGTHAGEASSYVNLARVQVQAGHPDSAAALLENGLARTFPNESILKVLEALRGGRGF